jgi:hypothetical protein
VSALKPLLVLGVILTAAGLASEQLGPIVGPVEYNGYLVFDYPEGDNPITNIVFEISDWISPSVIIVDVPTPWTYTFSEPILTLSGGSLNPGGSVSVVVSLDDYFDEGEYTVSSIGTTSAGEVSNAKGPLLVGDLYLLRAISLANTYQTPLIGSVFGLIALELMFWWRNRPFRSMIPPAQEVNDFVRESQKILNKEGTPKIKVPENNEDPDPGHESVIPELGKYDFAVPIDRSKPDPPGHSGDGLKEDTPEKTDETAGIKSIPEWNKAKAPDNIAKVIGDVLTPESEFSGVDPPDPSDVPDTVKTVETEFDDSDLPGLDDIPDTEYDDSDLPGLDDIPDPPEYDNSDLPGLEKPETEPSSPGSDNSDLPGLEKPETEPTDRAWDSDLPEWIDNPPEIEPFPKNTEADLKELEEIRAKEKKLPRLRPDEKVSG